MTEPLLELQEVTVRFGGHVAVDSVDLSVDPGTITGLIGPNGAGKTTTFNVITGLQAATTGRLRFAGQDITRARAHRRAQAGIGRTFQRLEVFGSLTAGERARRRRAAPAVGPADKPTPVALALLAETGLIQPSSGPEVLGGILARGDRLAADLVGIRHVADTRPTSCPPVSHASSSSAARSPPDPACCSSTSRRRVRTRARPRRSRSSSFACPARGWASSSSSTTCRW